MEQIKGSRLRGIPKWSQLVATTPIHHGVCAGRLLRIHLRKERTRAAVYQDFPASAHGSSRQLPGRKHQRSTNISRPWGSAVVHEPAAESRPSFRAVANSGVSAAIALLPPQEQVSLVKTHREVRYSLILDGEQSCWKHTHTPTLNPPPKVSR